MTSSLVGSEMCIRDREGKAYSLFNRVGAATKIKEEGNVCRNEVYQYTCCLLYTSDAADDM
eukprot:11984819-Prorocentrum_lima.AAC.1